MLYLSSNSSEFNQTWNLSSPQPKKHIQAQNQNQNQNQNPQNQKQKVEKPKTEIIYQKQKN